MTLTTDIGLIPSTYIQSLAMSDIILDHSMLGHLLNFDYDCSSVTTDQSLPTTIYLSNIYSYTSASSALSSSDHPFLSFKGVDYVIIEDSMFNFDVDTTSDSVIKFVPGGGESG